MSPLPSQGGSVGTWGTELNAELATQFAARIQTALRPVNALDPPYNADPTGVVDATAALNAALATGAPVEFQGAMKVSAPLTMTGKFAPKLKAAGGRGSAALVPTPALSGLAMLLIKNCSHPSVEDVEFRPGVPATAPACAIEAREDHGDTGSNPGGYTSTGLKVRDCILGGLRPGAGAGGLVDGIRWTTAGLNQNNDLGEISGVSIANFSGAAYNIGHSNSLGHQIEGGAVAHGPTVVKLAGGSFTMDKTWLGDITSWIFDFLAGTYFHPSMIGAVSVEQATLLIRSVVTSLGLSVTFNGSDLTMGASSTTPISWAANAGRLSFVGCPSIFGGAGTAIVLSATHASSIIELLGGYAGLTDYQYAGTLILDGVTMGPGSGVLLTPASSAARRYVRNVHYTGGNLNDDGGERSTPYVFPSPLWQGVDAGAGALGANEYIAYDVTTRHRANRMLFEVITSAGSVQAKIYNAALDEIATSGTVACPAVGGAAVPITDVELTPGRYYCALASNNGTATFRYRSGLRAASALDAIRYTGGSYPLPATVNGAPDVSSGNAYLIVPAYEA